MTVVSEPAFKHIESFAVSGFSTKTQNCDESNEKTAKIPHLWQQFYTSNLATHNQTIFGVYSDYESNEQGLYTVTAGITSEEMPAHLNSVTVPTGNYLVFKDAGPMPSTVIQLWGVVWQYFATTHGYQRTFMSDFEAYTDTDEVAIYIGVY
ncbi:MAG: effector binding domain-containing protein [Legionellaceae bacterium]|nr:effector binding domain-containing protein [Legionellaceae bacterium]